MGKKIFVSYKYADSRVKHLDSMPWYETTTARHYVDVLQSKLDAEDHINKGEKDDEDLSHFKNDTIKSKLRDKIFDSSVTVVLISPGMKESWHSEKDLWISWEISYSLRETTRNDRTSRRNGVLAVVLPDENGSYNYAIEKKTTAHVYSMLTMALFETIDEIECPILIESENSVALDEGIKKGTLSPWIYEEVGFMGRLPHNIQERFLRQRTFSVGTESVMLNESVRDSVQMVHPLDTKGFKQIEKPDLTSMSLASGEKSLNILYKRRLLLKRTVL